jgi:hypothetical protein
VPVEPIMPPPDRLQFVPRPGELTTAWRILTVVGWTGVVIALAATWNASRQLGLATWWLGPANDQQPPYIILLPFVAPVIIVTAVGSRTRYVPWIGVLGAVATAAVGLGDIGRVRGLGLVELIAAAAALLVSVASFSGMYRRAAIETAANDAGSAGVDAAVPSG